MAKNLISAELDDIANGMEVLAKKNPRHAKRIKTLCAQLDTVSNQVDGETDKDKDEDDNTDTDKEERTSSRRQAAAPEIEDGMWPAESDYQDSYEADDYHKVPVGSDSLSKAIDKNVPDIVSELQFAQNTSGKDKHRILIQADRHNKNGRTVSWPFADLTPTHLTNWARQGQWDQIRQAASMALSASNVSGSRTAAEKSEMEVDLGRYGKEDNLSTADLAESGNEDITKPIDADDAGGILQFFGTYPQKSNDDGPDSGHHRRNVQAPNRTTSSRARSLLERVADRPVKPEVKQPDDLLNDEPGNNVERDNPLGGLSGQYKGRSSSRESANGEIKVYRPQHVPKELHGLWHRAAQKVASQGQIRLSSGEVNYYSIDDTYRDALGYFRKQAAKHTQGRTASSVRYASTPESVKVVKPDYVPRELLSYWNGAAKRLGDRDRLILASNNRVDYNGINNQYINFLDRVLSVQAD